MPRIISLRAPRGRALATTAIAALLATMAPAAAIAAGPTLDRLAVSVVGDGASTGNTAVPVSIQLVDGHGQRGDTIAVPTRASGSQHPFTLGADRAQQGTIAQSGDHRFLTLAGFTAAPGTLAPQEATAPESPRVIARVDAHGEVATDTTLGGGFSKRHVRAAATIDGSRYWASGHGGDAVSPAGALLSVADGEGAPVAVVSGSRALNNARVVGVHDGELYLTSDRPGYSGVNQVGSGAPSTASALTLITAAPAGATVPQDFAFAGDSLYVSYTEGPSRGIAKYHREGASWAYVASTPGDFGGLEARPAGSETVLYAVRGSTQGNELLRLTDSGQNTAFTARIEVLAQADPGTAFRGVAFAPGFLPGSDAVTALPARPVITWTNRVAGGTGAALGAVLGQPHSPSARGTAIDERGTALTLTATSSNPAVLPDSAITLTRPGAHGEFTLSAAPLTAGFAIISLRARTADGRETTANLAYRVAPAFTDPAATAHFGMSDASASVDAGEGYFFAADDDSNAIRLFSEQGGEPVAEYDFSSHISFFRPGDSHDFEAVARVGNTVYWISSLGNTRSGNVRLDRDIIIQTTLSGSGAKAQLSFAGYRNVLRDALVSWDHSDAHGLGADHFGLHAATQPGSSAEGAHSLNIEGASMAPDGSTLWLGFRSPVVGATEQALIVPIADIAGVVAGAEPVVGAPILLDLGGRAIRDLARTDSGDYLIIAGSADDAGRFALYGWSGNPTDAPVASLTPIGLAGWPGSYEGIVGLPSLADGVPVRLLLDSGTVRVYGDGIQAQNLASPEFKVFTSQRVSLNFGGHFGVAPAEQEGAAKPGEAEQLLPGTAPATGVVEPAPAVAEGSAIGALPSTGAHLGAAALTAMTLLAAGIAVMVRRRGHGSARN